MVERMFEYWYASRPTAESNALLERAREASRREAAAAAERLDVVGALFVLRCRESGDRAEWATDTWEAVAAQVAAALRTSVVIGSSYLRYAMAMRNRLPKVGQAFRAGDIDYRAFQTIVFRTDLITDAEVLAKVDAQLAALLARCPAVTRGRLSVAVDQVVADVDRDAVRRVAEAADGRFVDVDVIADGSGLAALAGSVLATAGRAFDRRLDELANTVCAADPRTREQRRADAVGALVAGSDRLACGCTSADCTAAARSAPSKVVIHVVADQSTVDGTGHTPAVLLGAEGLIPASLIAELAKVATLRPLMRPSGRPESGYAPSAGLAEFVRCRDLTCRAPGCDQPAVCCDLDHTVAYGDGGHTHASNLKCLCRKHHLLKTFWGWRDLQLPDGTVIWLLPDGHTYVTTPGSALLFRNLCVPTGELPPIVGTAGSPRAGRAARMPTRARTRAQNRANRIDTERRCNRRALEAVGGVHADRYDTPEPTIGPDEPPPF